MENDQPLPTEEYDYREVSRNEANTCVYVECTDCVKRQCPARGKIQAGVLTWTISHNHEKNSINRLIKKMKLDLQHAVVSSMDDFRVVYDRIALLHPNVASFVTFKSMKTSMLRWRQKIRPSKVASLHEYLRVINLDKWIDFRKYSFGTITVNPIVVNNETIAVILGDLQFLALLNNIQELHIDATFEVCPRNISNYIQLLTIMATVSDTALPITWAIMTSKTTAAYTAILNHFSQVFALNINPSSVSVDFEEGLSSAIDAVFPNAKIIRCYFHFLNASMRNLKKKGTKFMERLKGWREGKIFYRKLMGIPLLPQEHIVLAFEWLLTNTVDDVKEQFADFIKYFEGWWIKRVTPIKLSVFLTEKVTNNEIEAYHRVLRKRMGSHPSIWQLTEYLKNLQSVTRSEWGSLMMGLSIRQPTENKYINKKEILHRAWKMYQDKLLDIPKFLACANNFLGCLQKFTCITESLHVDLFVNIQSHNVAVHPVPYLRGINIGGDDGIVFLKIQQPVIGENIFYVNNLAHSKCSLCQKNIGDMISLPCWHWFGCNLCAQKFTNQAIHQKADLLCPICSKIIRAFQRIIIT